MILCFFLRIRKHHMFVNQNYAAFEQEVFLFFLSIFSFEGSQSLGFVYHFSRRLTYSHNVDRILKLGYITRKLTLLPNPPLLLQGFLRHCVSCNFSKWGIESLKQTIWHLEKNSCFPLIPLFSLSPSFRSLRSMYKSFPSLILVATPETSRSKLRLGKLTNKTESSLLLCWTL